MVKENIEKNQVVLASPVKTGFKLAFGFWLFTLVLFLVLFILFLFILSLTLV